MAHMTTVEPIFLCSWSSEIQLTQGNVGMFLCGRADLEQFLLARDLPQLVALQVLTPTGPCSWALRNALTVAHRFIEGDDTAEFVFSDDRELFDGWSHQLPQSITLVPLWSAPNMA